MPNLKELTDAELGDAENFAVQNKDWKLVKAVRVEKSLRKLNAN